MRISEWSSDVCSSDLVDHALMHGIGPRLAAVGLFGGYIRNVEDRDPATWLRHIAAFDFGAELVHDAPFPEWTPALEAEVAAQWRDRLRTPGAAALLDDRDRTTARIARWHAPPAQVGRSHPSFARDYRDGREKFLDAASQAGARMEAHCLPDRPGPDGKPL